MTPTPLYRPRSISVSKRVFWALSTIATGLRGNGPVVPELTTDGIADTLLTEAIETKWGGLLDGYKKREQIDADYQAMVKLSAADGKHDREVLKAKEGQA